MPNRARRPMGRMARQSVSAQGQVQTRSTTARGIRWEESWPILKAGEAEVERLLAFIERHARLGTLFWVQHPTLLGARNPSGGAADENLIRDAEMKDDTNGDGVVDSWNLEGSETGWTAKLDTTDDSQEFEQDGTGLDGDQIFMRQEIVRVFAGDVITLSIEARTTFDPVSDVQTQWTIRFRDADGSQFGGSAQDFTLDGSFSRLTRESIEAPDGAASAFVRVLARLKTDGVSGSVFWRNARLLRASSDPATYANPHVSGGSQTGDTLDTAGWPASTTNVVRAGDLIRIGGSGATQADAEADEIVTAFRATEDADSDSNGDATLTIEPEILSGNTPADGAALRLQKSRIRAKIVDYTMPEALPSELMGGLRVTFLEAP